MTGSGSPATESDSADFILLLARALHRFGYPSHSLEETLAVASQRLGIEAQFFATPTAIFAGFGTLPAQRSFLIRTEPGEVNLEKLSQLVETTRGVLGGGVSPAEGSRRVHSILVQKPRYGRVLTVLAYAVAAAGGSRFLGGGLREIAASAGIGLLIGSLALAARRSPRAVGRIFEPAAAFLASLLAAGIAARVMPLSIFNVTLASLLVLLPGLTLTVAFTELASRHLVSGTSRFSGAVMMFLAIGIGVAIGTQAAGRLFGHAPHAVIQALPAWTLLPALLLGPVAFAVQLKADPRDIPWILLAGWAAFLGGRAGVFLLGRGLGVFVGALSLGLASNFYTRLRGRPASVTLVPGLILLVPGSVGFQSVQSLLGEEVLPGVGTAIRVMVMGAALAAGLLVADIGLPPRRVA